MSNSLTLSSIEIYNAKTLYLAIFTLQPRNWEFALLIENKEGLIGNARPKWEQGHLNIGATLKAIGNKVTLGERFDKVFFFSPGTNGKICLKNDLQELTEYVFSLLNMLYPEPPEEVAEDAEEDVEEDEHCYNEKDFADLPESDFVWRTFSKSSPPAAESSQ